MLCYEPEIAKEIGDRAATVLQQLHYWTSKGYGKKIDGRTYIYNTYEEWHEQFPHWSVMTIRRLFSKLVDLEIIHVHRKGYDRRSYWSINYSHPICAKWSKPSVQNEQKEVFNLNSSIGTYPNQRQHTKPTAVGENRKPTTSQPTTYRKEFPEAKEWLEKKDKGFRAGVLAYIDYHVNSPRVKFPEAFKMKLITEIWRKYTGQIHHTDFDYVDKSKITPTFTPAIEVVKGEIKYDEAIDAEMMNLISQGVVPCQVN